MFCHACGSALTQPTKYCNRCGAQLATADIARKDKTTTEKRLDDYLDGLFWITIFGLSFVLGGMVLLKKVGFGDLVVLTYVVLSAAIFMINFAMSLWTTLGIMRRLKEERVMTLPGSVETSELNPARPEMFIAPASITENTTRSFEPVPQSINRSGSE